MVGGEQSNHYSTASPSKMRALQNPGSVENIDSADSCLVATRSPEANWFTLWCSENFQLVHTVFGTPWRTLAQSSPSTVTAGNQCAAYIGIFVHEHVESSPQAFHKCSLYREQSITQGARLSRSFFESKVEDKLHMKAVLQIARNVHSHSAMTEEGLGKESAMAFARDPSQHSRGVISGNHGKPKIRMAGPGIELGSSRMRVQCVTTARVLRLVKADSPAYPALLCKPALARLLL
ncbi:hypothetical protein PR048_031172 [Dryococelus australis]|uniref:Uncharacterized protein n=1 Tax=Dryococelus australis TaxID=614101 RepID=A0ABQ9G7A4_9NEOP|nr:hypothetical protein PR048_031172 [Dryococelus australis]